MVSSVKQYMDHYNLVQSILIRFILLNHIEASVFSRDNIHLTQYWKFFNRPNVTTGSSTNYWMSYIERHLQDGMNDTDFTKACLSQTFKILMQAKLSKYFSYGNVTSGNRLILAAVIPGRRTKYTKYTIIISPNITFNMNLTFTEFRLTGAVQCLHGFKHNMLEYMSIMQHTTSKDGVCHKRKTWRDKNYPAISQCKYEHLCGHYPAHIRFLLYPRTQLGFAIRQNVISTVKMLFQIISSNFATHFSFTCFWVRCIYTKPTSPNIETVMKVQLMTTYHSERYYTLRIATTHVKRLLIYQNTTIEGLVFDGPFLECDRLRGSKTDKTSLVYKATSFLVTLLQKEEIYRTTYQYRSQPVVNRTHINFPGLITFPWPSCKGQVVNFCVLNINNLANQGINITMGNILYKGPSILADNCMFGGIVIYFKNNDKEQLEEILLECEDVVFEPLHQSANVTLFSGQNTQEIWISTYSYSVYSHIQAEIILSKASCKGVHIIPVKHKQCHYSGSSLTRTQDDFKAGYKIHISKYLLQGIFYVFLGEDVERWVFSSQ